MMRNWWWRGSMGFELDGVEGADQGEHGDRALQEAIHGDDREMVVRLLRRICICCIFHWDGNWGPPMSHAANLGRLEIIKAVAAAGRGITSMRSIALCCRGNWNPHGGAMSRARN
jgi:hypothetical protein